MKLAGLVLLIAATPAGQAGWPQFGGPSRDFRAAPARLAETWPHEGPRVVWSRDLGEGYSGIAEDGGMLFTMYRPLKPPAAGARFQGTGVEPEIVVALDAASGKTLWEHRYDAPFLPGMNMEYGPGPHVTPLVAGDRVVTVGVTGKLHALDKRTGKLLWSHDLVREYGAKVMGRGYSCSPLSYGETVVLTVGGEGQAAMAFHRRDGRVVWKNGSFDPSPASPIRAVIGGQEQLVFFHADGVAGLDPRDGSSLWNHPHKTDWGLNISTPVWGDDNLLFISSAYSGGSRLLQLTRSAGKTSVQERWFTNRMRIHFGPALRLGDHIYGSSGDFGPAFFTALDVRTGQVAWQDRTLARASFVYADGRLVLLDEDGTLALASVSPQGLTIHAKALVLSRLTWTAPTLVGTRLYVRDRVTLKALDLG